MGNKHFHLSTIFSTLHFKVGFFVAVATLIIVSGLPLKTFASTDLSNIVFQMPFTTGSTTYPYFVSGYETRNWNSYSVTFFTDVALTPIVSAGMSGTGFNSTNQAISVNHTVGAYLNGTSTLASVGVGSGTGLPSSSVVQFNCTSSTYKSCSQQSIGFFANGVLKGSIGFGSNLPIFDISNGIVINPLISPDTTPRLISLVTPSLASVVASGGSFTSVPFSVNLYNDSATSISISISSPEILSSFAPIILPVFQSGNTIVSATSSLPNGFYNVVVSAIGTSTAITNVIFSSFTVGTSTFSNMSIVSTLSAVASTSASCTSASSTDFVSSAIYGIGCFLFVPSPASISQFSLLQSLIQTVVPFAYFFQIRTLLLVVSSASSSLATLSLPPIAGVLATSTPILNDSIMQTYFPTATSDAFKLLTGASLWLMFIYFEYRRIPKLFQNQK